MFGVRIKKIFCKQCRGLCASSTFSNKIEVIGDGSRERRKGKLIASKKYLESKQCGMCEEEEGLGI